MVNYVMCSRGQHLSHSKQGISRMIHRKPVEPCKHSARTIGGAMIWPTVSVMSEILSSLPNAIKGPASAIIILLAFCFAQTHIITFAELFEFV